MSTFKIILIFFLLPFLAPILFPPDLLVSGFLAVIITAVLFVGLGFLLLRGSARALTLAIFLQGLNAIVRIMMFFPHATFPNGSADIIYIVTSILSISLSVYLLIRLDQVDIRTRMVR
jgi:hypothetical protein